MTSSAIALVLIIGSGPQAFPSLPQALAYEAAAPFGGYRAVWSFEASGQGRYLFDGPGSARPHEGELDIGPDGFLRLNTALSSLEGETALSCNLDDGPYIHDAAGGTLSWTRSDGTTSHNLDFGCVSEAGRADAARIREADAMVRQWAAEARGEDIAGPSR